MNYAGRCFKWHQLNYCLPKPTHTLPTTATKQRDRDCWQEQTRGRDDPSALHRPFCFFLCADHICLAFITTAPAVISVITSYVNLVYVQSVRCFLPAIRVTVLFSLFFSALFMVLLFSNLFLLKMTNYLRASKLTI